MLLVYPELLGRAIGEEVFEQLASAISECNQFSGLWWKIMLINTEYLSQGDTL